MTKSPKRTKQKIKYLLLCNCTLLLVFLILLGTLFYSENDPLKNREQAQNTVAHSAKTEQKSASNTQTEQKPLQSRKPEVSNSSSEESAQSTAQPSEEGQSGSKAPGRQQGPDASVNSQETNKALPQQNSQETNKALPQQDSQETNKALSQQAHQETNEALLQQIQVKIASMTLEEKAAQLFLITPEALTGRSSVTKAGEDTRNALNQYPVGGLIFFESNIQSRQQVTEMLKMQQEYSKERIGLPLFLSVDEEGGQVTRIASAFGNDVEIFPDISEIGASGDARRAYQLGDAIGEYLSDMGFNLDFAPVADVLTNPENVVVRRRSYGSDPQVVSEMVKNNLEGLKDHRVFGCVKHFPGHGATEGDTHQGYAYSDKTWEELKSNDAVPFQESIHWGVKFVMVGHISLPEVTGNDTPASLSSYVIGHLLREELGYDGVVLTDALNMKAVTDQYTSSQAAVEAVLAGNDMILMPEDFHSAYQGIIDAVKNGVISKERLDESLRRILELKMCQ